jgi:hypothetical protein
MRQWSRGRDGERIIFMFNIVPKMNFNGGDGIVEAVECNFSGGKRRKALRKEWRRVFVVPSFLSSNSIIIMIRIMMMSLRKKGKSE